MPTELNTTPHQTRALEAALAWLDRSAPAPHFALGGFAGTGKTYLLSRLIPLLESKGWDVLVTAPTGKAASVLTRKGVPTTTVHSACFSLSFEKGKPPIFPLKSVDELFSSPKALLVVDEASMVNEWMYEQLETLRRQGVRILYVGDHGQLEPVGDDPALLARPDARLEEIIRQAEGNPIIPFSHAIREGREPTACGTGDSTVTFLESFAELAQTVDRLPQIICAWNATRRTFNHVARHALHGLPPGSPPTVGDRIICLRNNHRLSVFNGQIATVSDINTLGEDTIEITVRLEDYAKDRTFLTRASYFDLAKPPAHKKVREDFSTPEDATVWTYAYALTCHKAQGSEWPEVCVIDEAPNTDLWSPARWRYTAATRASDRLYWMSPTPR